LEYIKRDQGRRKKEEYYFAQLAAEFRRTMVKNPKSVKMEDFLFNPPTPEVERMKKSKSTWLKALQVQAPEEN